MKRAGVSRLGAADDPGLGPQQPINQLQQQPGASNMHTLAQSAQPMMGTAGHMSVVSGGTATMLSVGGGFVRGVGAVRAPSPQVIHYQKPQVQGVQYAAKQQPQPMQRHKPLGNQSPGGAVPVQVSISSGGAPTGGAGPQAAAAPGAAGPGGATQFQRLKVSPHPCSACEVEDALSYLDQVKYKFNAQPQVYNDFLDIMKEFKSQSIDTPGVIARVSNLFKGHPELIVGFNTFLPPGYKIEVQSNGQGVAYQVSVSMPSPTALAAAGAGGGVLLGAPTQPQHHAAQPQHQPQLVHILPPVPQAVSSAMVHSLAVSSAASNTLHHISQAHQQIEAAAAAAQHHATAGGVVSGGGGGGGTHPTANTGQPVEFNHAIEYVNKIKSRFTRQPEKYKRFLEILHAYQRGHRDVKEAQVKQQTEQEVYSQVAKLFENQDDLLSEFGQFLPDASSSKPGVVSSPAPAIKGHIYAPPQQAQAMPIQPHTQQRRSLDGECAYATAPPPAPHASPPHHHAPHPPHAQLVSKQTGGAPGGAAAPAQPQPQLPHLKRSPSFTTSSQIGAVSAPPAKKPRCTIITGATVRDVSYAEAAKVGELTDFSFFDRVRRALRSQEVYDNFLRCLLLFTNEIVSSSELVSLTAPFLHRHPELHKWLQDFLGTQSAPDPQHAGVLEKASSDSTISSYNNLPYTLGTGGGLLASERAGGVAAAAAAPAEAGGRAGPERPAVRYETVGPLGAQFRHDRAQGDAAMDVDLSTCKRLGTSYCALPRGSADSASRRCSGRTPLCREVLNDTWVSFPTWSEDSTFVTSRKTQYEEYIYRCEDERFELDVVIETNASTIRVLEGVQKKMSRMTGEDVSKFRLDDCLGGTSPTIHQRALRRIYGEKVAVDIIAGLKKNPLVAVPVVLRRLKAKEDEWREAQKGFNKQWREQNEKYYLKSLDHQGINFKQNDLKALRSKSLFSDMETAYAAGRPGPHLSVSYGVRSRQEGIKILRDAAELLIHHARRQTAIQKAEKRRIKQLLRQFIPDLFDHPRQPPSDDERDDEEKEEGGGEGGSSPAQDENTSGPANRPDSNTTPPIKQEKQEPSSESDTNTSDRGGARAPRSKEPLKTSHSNSTENGSGKENNGGSIGKRSDSSNGEELKTELQEEVDIKDAPGNEARFVCTSSWYLFLRLHGVLCARLADARRAAAALAEQDARDQRTRHPSVALALRLKPSNAVQPGEYYNTLLELVRGVLDGNTEAAGYEDAVREMLGIRAYPAYTLDKVVSYAVRQLQHCVSEAWSVKACEMAARGGMRAGGAAYVRRARRYLRAEHAATLVRVYGGDECRVTYELLESGSDAHDAGSQQQACGDGPADSVSRLAAWSLYNERFARPDVEDGASGGSGGNKPVFLRRNVRRCGGGDGPARAATQADCTAAPHARRKPPKILDTSEATLAGRLRLVASRPHQLYRRGCLRGARDTQAKLNDARKAKFRVWHRRKLHH